MRRARGCYRCVVSHRRRRALTSISRIPDGITPLINALDTRSFDIAMFLLDKGANPGTWDMTGRTPLYVAVDMNSYGGRSGAGNGAFQGFEDPTGRIARRARPRRWTS